MSPSRPNGPLPLSEGKRHEVQYSRLPRRVREEKTIVHTVRQGKEVLIFEQVPADFCPVCGDTLLKPETVRQLERLLRTKSRPDEMIPLYKFA